MINFAKSLLGLTVCFVWLSGFAHTDDEHAEAPATKLTAAEQQVVATLDAYAAAYAATDLQAIRALIAGESQFSYFEGASADVGWADYEAHAGAEMPAFSEAKYVFTNVQPEISGAMAFATFAWMMDVVIISEQFEGGRHPVSMEGLGTAVLVAQGDDWKLRHLHTVRRATPKAKP